MCIYYEAKNVIYVREYISYLVFDPRRVDVSGPGVCCVCASKNGSDGSEYGYTSGMPASRTNPRFCMNSGRLSDLYGQLAWV